MFGEDGLVQSGLFSDGKLAFAFDVTNQANGFLSISGKSKKKQSSRTLEIRFGEHNENDKLDGRGICINDGNITVGYWKYG